MTIARTKTVATVLAGCCCNCGCCNYGYNCGYDCGYNINRGCMNTMAAQPLTRHSNPKNAMQLLATTHEAALLAVLHYIWTSLMACNAIALKTMLPIIACKCTATAATATGTVGCICNCYTHNSHNNTMYSINLHNLPACPTSTAPKYIQYSHK